MNNYFYRFFFSSILLCITLSVSSQERYPFQNEKGLYGFKDENGKVKIKPQFEKIDGFELTNDQGWSHRVRGVKLNGKWGYINRDGDIIIPYQYDLVSGMTVTNNGKSGLIDESGKQLLPMQYATLQESYPLFLVSMDNRKYGFVDSSGKEVIPMVYDECRPFDNETIITKNKEGGYDWRNPNRLAAVKLNGSWGFINIKNDFMIPPIYKVVEDFKISYAWVSVDGEHYGALSRTNRLAVPFLFTNVGTWGRDGTSSANIGSVAGTVNSKAVFTGDRMQPTQFTLYASEPASTEPMIKSGYQAIKEGYPKEAIQWFVKAYNNGSTKAAKELAYLYAADTSKKTNWQTAIQWYRKGASRSDLVCLTEIARMHLIGKDVPRNDSAAFDVFKRIGALINGYDLAHAFSDDNELDFVIDGLKELAGFYIDGIVTPRDPVQAFYWHRKAAEAGSYYANLQVANAYYKGEGTEKNLTKAFDYYLLVADEYDEAMYAIGIMYYNGEGIEKNKESGIKWLKMAASNGYSKAIDFLKKQGAK